MNAQDIIKSRIGELNLDRKREAARQWLIENGLDEEDGFERWKLGVQFDCSVQTCRIAVVTDYLDNSGNWADEHELFFALDDFEGVLLALRELCQKTNYVRS